MNEASAWRHQAQARMAANDIANAHRLYSQLAALPDAHVTDVLALGRLDFRLDRLEAAAAHAQRAAQMGTDQVEVAAQTAALLFDVGLIQQSLDCLDLAAARQPDNPDLQLLLAQALADVGKREQAISVYLRALALHPRWAAALGGLLQAARGRAEPEWLAQASALLDDPATTEEERSILGYGLGRALESQGRHEEAFGAWQVANRARRQQAGALNRAGLEAHVSALVDFYNAPLLAQTPAIEPAERQPVFIVGMPRSGTTLLEQMLSAHSRISGYGELPTVSRLFNRLHASAQPRPGFRPARMTDVVPLAQLQGWADHYHSELKRRATDQKADHSIDKAPLNFFRVGLISQLFPQARIIVCQRDPRDVCLSIYSENFGLGHTFATELEDLAYFYRMHERLVGHWLAALPERVRMVRYETLIDAPEKELKGLIAWLGLAWEDAILDFHQRESVVLTPSKWQVRSPLYRSSIGRWRNHQSNLQPLLDVFGDQDTALSELT